MAILSGVSDVKPEAKKSPNKQNAQAALLLRDAFTYRAATNKTVMVIANGHVTLTPVGDIDVAMQFTIAQWNEIVEFVDSQLLQAFEDEQDKRASRVNWASWEVDWSQIPGEYSYAAIDEDGRAFGYSNEPRIIENTWGARGEYFRLKEYDNPSTVANWRTSVIRRPGL